ncbi:MAG: hypothetical protein DCC49_07215 [Acidobacteria bacterium]|nr:MAG: hypothetical protein DCC49_07215 [Acidobacteriota bacterium]
MIGRCESWHRLCSRGDEGTGLPEFIAGLTLLVMTFLVVAQAAIYVYVENVAVAAVYEGARRGAELGAGNSEAQERATEVLEGAVGGYARQLRVEIARRSGVVEASVVGEIEPLIPLIPRLPISARAQVLSENEVLL